jgi:MFS family permease
MVPLGLFRSSTFAGTNLLTLLLYGALGGALFFLPLNLVQIQGYSATAAGAALLPFVLILFVLSRWAGGLADRYGVRLPLTVGSSLAALGFALFALPGETGSYWLTIFPAATALGLGMAVVVAPLTTTVMNAVDQDHAGTASGINNAVSRVATLLAISVLGIVMLSSFGSALEAAEKPDHRPIAPPRTSAGKEALISARLPGMRSAPPSPCSVRAAIR